MNNDDIIVPMNDITLKSNRKFYHERQLFHLYVVFVNGLWEIALSQGRSITFLWNSSGEEQLPLIQ